MTSVTELFEISSQQKFIDFSMAVLEGKLDFPANVKFKDWPKIELNIKGKRYHSSLPRAGSYFVNSRELLRICMI